MDQVSFTFHPGLVLLWNSSNMLCFPSVFQRWMKYVFYALNIGYDLRALCASRISLELSQKFFVIKGAIWAHNIFFKSCKMETYFYYFKVTGFNTKLALAFGEGSLNSIPLFFFLSYHLPLTTCLLNKWNKQENSTNYISCGFQDLPNRVPYKLGNIKFLWKSLPLKCKKKQC